MLPVLMYHSVSSMDSGPMRPLAVSRGLLTDQLTALRDGGYTLVGLTEALARHDRDPLTHGLVAVTFDDGFVNFATAGLAALAAAGSISRSDTWADRPPGWVRGPTCSARS